MGGPDVAINVDELERGEFPKENHNQHQHTTPGYVPRSEYRDQRITPELLQRPWLDILDEFLEPNKECFAVRKNRRMLFFDVKVIHILTSGEVTLPIKCENLEQFEQAVGSNADEERNGTLVMVEDLSRVMIDALGMKYNLEPEFFANHLGGTEPFRMGKWQTPTVRAPNILPGYLRKAPYYTLEFRRPYHFPGGSEEIIKLRSNETCTPRGAQTLKEDFPDAFVVEKISVYKRKGSKTAIILTDKLLLKDPPRPHILDPVSSLDDDSNTPGTKGRRDQVSCRIELIGWLQRLSPQDAKALFDDHEPLALRPVLKIVERASAMFLAHALFTMYRIVTWQCDEQFPDSIPFALRVSRSLHRHIHAQRKSLRVGLRVASLKGAENIAEQVQDIKFLIEDMDGALRALEEDVRFIVSAASIKEGKLVTWVSKYAFLFLPVTTVATILGISEQVYTRLAILGSLTVPFVLISIFFMFFWKPSHIDSLRL